MRKIYRTQNEAAAVAAARSTDGAKWVIHCHAHPSGCYWTVSPNRETRRTQKKQNEKREIKTFKLERATYSDKNNVEE